MDVAMGDSDGNTLVKFQIERLDNNTFLATLMTAANSSGLHGRKAYDDEGALYYVVAVVFIYGFSIILMIGSLIKRNKGDNGVSKYMKDMDKVRRLERRQKKYQTRLAMSAAGGSRRASRALAARGCNVDLGPYSAPPGGAAPTDAAFNWDEEFNTSDIMNPVTPGNCSVDGLNPPRFLPLLGRPPPGRAVQLSPRHSMPPDLTQIQEIPTSDDTKEDSPQLDGGGVSVLKSYGGVVDVGGGEGEGMIQQGGCSTVLYIENEKDSKCKVSIVPQVQLDTVHEIDEEHACSQENTNSAPIVNV